MTTRIHRCEAWMRRLFTLYCVPAQNSRMNFGTPIALRTLGRKLHSGSYKTSDDRAWRAEGNLMNDLVWQMIC